MDSRPPPELLLCSVVRAKNTATSVTAVETGVAEKIKQILARSNLILNFYFLLCYYYYIIYCRYVHCTYVLYFNNQFVI